MTTADTEKLARAAAIAVQNDVSFLVFSLTPFSYQDELEEQNSDEIFETIDAKMEILCSLNLFPSYSWGNKQAGSWEREITFTCKSSAAESVLKLNRALHFPKDEFPAFATRYKFTKTASTSS